LKPLTALALFISLGTTKFYASTTLLEKKLLLVSSLEPFAASGSVGRIRLFILMWIRILFFTSMRIRILLFSVMRIRADPDPKPYQ
jgi:hypothetical protein